MDGLYIEVSLQRSALFVDVQTAVILYMLNFCSSSLQINLVQLKAEKRRMIGLEQDAFSRLRQKLVEETTVPAAVRQCQMPLLASSGCSYIQSGLCSVLRTIIKKTSLQESVSTLLGHKQVCLKAPAEVSSWTCFCEVDIPAMVSQRLQIKEPTCVQIPLPAELLKLENHLSEPAIIPNKGKREREALKGAPAAPSQSIQSSNNMFDKESLLTNLEHCYAEGADFTLTDLILFPCVSFLLDHWRELLTDINKHIPRVFKWFQRVAAKAKVQDTMVLCGFPKIDCHLGQEKDVQVNHKVAVVLPDTADISALTIRDPCRKKMKADSEQVRTVIKKLQQSGISLHTFKHPHHNDLQLPWKQLPAEVHPSQGDLPAQRVERKCQQLESLASVVTKMARDGNIIVDFCAGGGHLGILLAYLLPKCKIMLVENKEESITRACNRIARLGLENITLYQCNLDYFCGAFDIGVCLHACGVATDLVLQRCLDNRASFVLCPCCYGSIHNTHTVTYPRSQEFLNAGISYKEYIILGHAADQTQFSIPLAQQGQTCMNYIDTDRTAFALEHGYQVTLCSLQPVTCSPKNSLLIGSRDK